MRVTSSYFVRKVPKCPASLCPYKKYHGGFNLYSKERRADTFQSVPPNAPRVPTGTHHLARQHVGRRLKVNKRAGPQTGIVRFAMTPLFEHLLWFDVSNHSIAPRLLTPKRYGPIALQPPLTVPNERSGDDWWIRR